MRRFWTALVCAFMMMVPVLATPVASAAPSDCSQKIIDQTTAHVLNIPEVTAAIKDVEKSGAIVYVRAFQETPTGSLKQWFDNQWHACADWQAVNGREMLPDIIVVSYGLTNPRSANISYGPRWHEALDDKWSEIRQDAMITNGINGDFNKGMVSALKQIAQAVGPTDWSGAITVFKWIGLALAIAMGVFLLVLAIRFVVEWAEDRHFAAVLKAETKAEAVANKQAAADAALHDVTDDALKVRFGTDISQLDPSLRAEFEKRFAALHDKAGVLIGQYAEDRPDLESEGLTTQDYAKQRDEYAAIKSGLDKVNSDYEAMSAEIGDLAQRTSLGARATRIQTVRQQLAQHSETLRGLGSMFSLAEELALVNDLTAQVQSASERLKTAEVKASHDAITACETGTAKLTTLVNGAVAVGKRLKGVRSEIDREVERQRTTLSGLTRVDTKSEAARLAPAAKRAIDRLGGRSTASKNPAEVSVFIDEQLESIKVIPRKKVADEQAIIESEKAEARRKARSRSSSYSRSSSSGSSDGGWGAGYVVGSSLGSGGSSGCGGGSISSCGGGGGSTGCGGGGGGAF